MNITGEILSRSAKGLKTTVKGFAARLGEKIGIVQKEVQECAGKSAQEIAEMTSKKDVAQVAAKNAENATAQTNKKLSIAERFKNFKAKLSDKLTNKIHVKDKSKMADFLPLVDEQNILICNERAQLKIATDEIPLLGKSCLGVKSSKIKDGQKIVGIIRT